MPIQLHSGNVLRVHCGFGNKQYQRYFNVSQEREASIYNKKLLKMKAAYFKKLAVENPPKVNRPGMYDTDCGVAGIRMSIVLGRGERSSPCGRLSLQAVGADGVTVSRTRHIREADTIDAKFLELLHALKTIRGLKRLPPHWVTENPPTLKRFRKLRNQMCRDGCTIAKDFIK